MTSTPEAGERPVEIAKLGDKHARLRLCGEEALRQMGHSLERHGQLTALVVYTTAEGGLEIVDGFKRQRAARQMGWTQLRARELGADVVAAAAAIVVLNEGHGLTELEEGWLCRLLHRDYGLPQHEVGRWLGRHKSWVCRRLLLAEGLDEAVQAHVRLGLVAPRTASELARLPRGNQLAAAEVVTKRGMTTAQAARLVQAVLSCPDASARAHRLTVALEAPEIVMRPAPSPLRRQGPAEALLRDIDSATRVSARLQARLREPSSALLDPRVAHLLDEGVRALSGVLRRLLDSLEHVVAGKDLRSEALE
jgi:ParB-like chromosome segregation protein Spo0J